MREEHIRRSEFLANVVSQLYHHPEWLGDTLKAVTQGVTDSIEAQRRRTSEIHVGLLAALAMVDKKRMSAKTTNQYNGLVLRGLGDVESIKRYGSEFEREWAERLDTDQLTAAKNTITDLMKTHPQLAEWLSSSTQGSEHDVD